MTRNLRLTRSLAVVRLRRRLEQESFPRIQMGFIVTLTGAAGLLCSFLLLHAGVDGMALRYPLALTAAYAFFLFLLWLWLHTQADDYADLPDLMDLVPVRGADNPTPSFSSGGGGDYARKSGASYGCGRSRHGRVCAATAHLIRGGQSRKGASSRRGKGRGSTAEPVRANGLSAFIRRRL